MLNSSSDKIFFQDFLYHDLPIKEGYIDFQIKYTSQLDSIIDLKYPNNLFDIPTKNRILSLEYLMSTTSKKEWLHLFDLATNVDKLIIIDDIEIQNIELIPYKEMLLKVYQYNFMKYCKNTLVYTQFYSRSY